MDTMQITLSSPAMLKVTWPLYDPAIDQEIRRRLATVPGIEAGRGREAWAPVIQLARLMLLFPKSSIDYRAVQEADCLARRFYESLVTMRVQLGFDEFEDVMGISDNVSPLLQQLIHERRHALKPFVVDPQPMPLPQIPRPVQPAIDVQYPKPKRRRAKRKVQR